MFLRQNLSFCFFGFFATTLVGTLILIELTTESVMSQDRFSAAFSEAFASINETPNRPRVPSPYGGYSSAAQQNYIQQNYAQENSLPRANAKTPANVAPTNFVVANSVAKNSGKIVQASYTESPNSRTPQRQNVPAYNYSAAQQKSFSTVPSPALSQDWDIETQVASSLHSAENGSLPRASTLYAAPNSGANRYTPMAAKVPANSSTTQMVNSSPVPRTVTPVSQPLWQQVVSDFRPSLHRKWQPNFAMLPSVEFHGNHITVRNIRYTIYRTKDDYTTRYYDATFNLAELQTIDLIMAPFPRMPSVAHVEISFGFSDGRQLALSIEPRFEEGENYDVVGAVSNQFELSYLFADERDVVRLYTQVGGGEVYLYRLNLTPEECRKVFEAAALRANTLAQKPEFYHAVTNNCATNLFKHINVARPNAIPRDYRARFPGMIDHLLLERQILVTSARNIKEVRANAKINWLAEQYGDLEYFSAGIRQNLF